jgi:E3 ubiquitin-protein ligase NEDD4
VLAVQIFDQKKFKKKDQGFLGVINVRIGSVIDLDAGGDGRFPETGTMYSTDNTPEMLTRDLKKSNDNMVVHGKLILNLSTNLQEPIRQGGATNGTRPTASPHPSVSGPSTNGASTPAQSVHSLHPDAFPGQQRPPVASQPLAHIRTLDRCTAHVSPQRRTTCEQTKRRRRI